MVFHGWHLIWLWNGCPTFSKHQVLYGPGLCTPGGQRASSCNHVDNGRGHRLRSLGQCWTAGVGWPGFMLGQVGDTRGKVGICPPLCSVLRWNGVWMFASPSLPGCTCGCQERPIHVAFHFLLCTSWKLLMPCCPACGVWVPGWSHPICYFLVRRLLELSPRGTYMCVCVLTSSLGGFPLSSCMSYALPGSPLHYLREKLEGSRESVT